MPEKFVLRQYQCLPLIAKIHMSYDPYVMIYNKPEAPTKIRKLQRWCNNKIIFGKVKRFEDYRR